MIKFLVPLFFTMYVSAMNRTDNETHIEDTVDFTNGPDDVVTITPELKTNEPTTLPPSPTTSSDDSFSFEPNNTALNATDGPVSNATDPLTDLQSPGTDEPVSDTPHDFPILPSPGSKHVMAMAMPFILTTML